MYRPVGSSTGCELSTPVLEEGREELFLTKCLFWVLKLSRSWCEELWSNMYVCMSVFSSTGEGKSFCSAILILILKMSVMVAVAFQALAGNCCRPSCLLYAAFSLAPILQLHTLCHWMGRRKGNLWLLPILKHRYCGESPSLDGAWQLSWYLQIYSTPVLCKMVLKWALPGDHMSYSCCCCCFTGPVTLNTRKGRMWKCLKISHQRKI